MKWIVDQTELKSRIQKGLAKHSEVEFFAQTLADEIYNDARQVMLLPDNGIMNTDDIVRVIKALPGNPVINKEVERLALALQPAIQAATDSISDAARESNLFLVGLVREGGKYSFLAKSGYGTDGFTDDPKEGAVYSRNQALGMALNDESYSALPVNAVALITGISGKKTPESNSAASRTAANSEALSAEYIKGYSQAIEKVLEQFDGILGFCHDPMGQDAIDQLQDAIKRLANPSPKTSNPKSPGF